MKSGLHPYRIPVNNEKSLFTLVENRTAYSFEACELNVFETHQQAEDVQLVFNDFVFTSMLRGKKVMHLKDQDAFDYLPGESVIVGPNEMMQIDFPEAREGVPTQCIALAISQQLIDLTLDVLNDKHPKVLESENWKIDFNINHIINNQELVSTINRIIEISRSDQGLTKDLYVDLALKEMLIRLMQTQARDVFTKEYKNLSSSHPLGYALEIINNKLHTKIDFDKLANAACMSRTTFFKKFKESFGYTPSQYVQQERLKLAKKWLKKKDCSVADACYNSGFENLSHFTKSFKKSEGISPSTYRKQNSAS